MKKRVTNGRKYVTTSLVITVTEKIAYISSDTPNKAQQVQDKIIRGSERDKIPKVKDKHSSMLESHLIYSRVAGIKQNADREVLRKGRGQGKEYELFF